MNTQSSTRESKRMQWDVRVALVIPGCIMLFGGIASLLRLAQSFAEDTFYSIFVTDWIPWVAVSLFVLGWLVAHGIEIAVFDLRIGLTRILAISLILLMLTLSWILPSLVSNPVLQRIDTFSMQFLFSGYFFRYAMFQKRALWFYPAILFGEKKSAEG